MNVPEHLPLSSRKALSGRLRIFDATTPIEERADLGGWAHAFKSYRSALASSVVELSGESGDGSPLDEFLHGFAQRAIQHAESPLVDESTKIELREIAKLVSTRLQEINCRTCSGTDSICRGHTLIDDPIVVRGGACLYPFNQQFELIKQEVLRLYQRHCSAPGVLQTTQVYLSTARYEGEGLGSCKRASAACHYKDDTNGRISEIRLHIDPDLLDVPSFLAVPYLFCHELVCHAWQGIQTKSAASRNKISSTRMDDYFAEGWMDAVAYHIFDAFVQRLSTSEALMRHEHRELALLVHNDRQSIWRNARLPDDLTERAQNLHRQRLARLNVGVRSALQFAQFLRDHADGFDPESAWYKISFDLNLRAEIVDRRQEFVTTAFGALFKRGVPSTQQMIRCVRNYMKNEDLRLFLQSWLGNP
jgi:hypothetical protein